MAEIDKPNPSVAYFTCPNCSNNVEPTREWLKLMKQIVDTVEATEATTENHETRITALEP